MTREERAATAKVEISTHFNSKQQVFLDFVLSRYISVGVEEFDQQKITLLLCLKYSAMQDAIAGLGQPKEIGQAFAGFQKTLYPAKVHNSRKAGGENATTSFFLVATEHLCLH